MKNIKIISMIIISSTLVIISFVLFSKIKNTESKSDINVFDKNQISSFKIDKNNTNIKDITQNKSIKKEKFDNSKKSQQESYQSNTEKDKNITRVAPFIPNLGEANMEENEKENYKEEIEKMRSKLKGNIMIPYDLSDPESNEQNKFFSEVFILEKKIDENSAAPKERIQYYEYKIKMLKDQIEIINYYQKKANEIEKETNVKYLSGNDIKEANETVEKLKKDIEQFQTKLKEIK